MTGDDAAVIQQALVDLKRENSEAHGRIENRQKEANGIAAETAKRVGELEKWQAFVKGVTAGVSSTINFQALIFGLLGGGGVIGIVMLIRGL